VCVCVEREREREKAGREGEAVELARTKGRHYVQNNFFVYKIISLYFLHTELTSFLSFAL
jgi:hypothetical protein